MCFVVALPWPLAHSAPLFGGGGVQQVKGSRGRGGCFLRWRAFGYGCAPALYPHAWVPTLGRQAQRQSLPARHSAAGGVHLLKETSNTSPLVQNNVTR